MNQNGLRDDALNEFSTSVVNSLEEFCSMRGDGMSTISKCVNELNESNLHLESRIREIIKEITSSHSVEASTVEKNSNAIVSPVERASISLQVFLLLTLTSLIIVSATTKKIHSTSIVNDWLNNFLFAPIKLESLSCEQIEPSVPIVYNALLLLETMQKDDQSAKDVEESLYEITNKMVGIAFGGGKVIYPSPFEELTVEKIEYLHSLLIPLCTQLLRSIKNLLRLFNLSKDNSNLLKPTSIDLCKQLRALPMMQIYLELLDAPSSVVFRCLTTGSAEINIESAPSSSSTQFLEENSVFFFKEACNTLLHALRGADSAAVNSFIVNTKVIQCLKRNFLLRQPVENIISIVRILHVLAGVIPDMLKVFDSDQSLKGCSEKRDIDGSILSLKTLLVATLAWCIRSTTPPFPGSDADQRPDLAEEILHTLFAMSSTSTGASSNSSNNSQEEEDTMTQIGILLCEIIRLPNADMRVYKCKLAAVKLMMEAPPGYAYFLLLNGGIPPLVTILMLQVTALVVEQSRSKSNGDALIVIPILAVLLKICKALPEAKDVVKVRVFPMGSEDNKKMTFSIASDDIVRESSENSLRIEAQDAPKGTLRWKLIKLMTWTDTNVKRCASEFLWTLCDENAEEFVRRTGLGNSIHMLGIKGLFNLPKNL